MMVRVALLATIAACTSTDLDVRVERQSSTLAQASADGWTPGGAVLVGAPGTFAFPQPLALRVMLVDGDATVAEGEAPEPLLISDVTLGVHGGAFEIVQSPVCQPTYCEAELSITSLGQHMVELTVQGKDATEHDCFYFAVFEGEDPEAARAQAETDQAACKQALLD